MKAVLTAAQRVTTLILKAIAMVKYPSVRETGLGRACHTDASHQNVKMALA